MARIQGSGPLAADPTSIDLTRLVARLQQTLLKPDETTERRLRTSPYERSKVGANLEYARKLLVRLEQDSLTIGVQSRRHEAQADLLRKREAIDRLHDQLEEYSGMGELDTEESSEGEDLLGEDTPSDEADEQEDSPHSPYEPSSPMSPSAQPDEHTPVISERDELFPSAVRARHAQAASQATDTAQTTSSDTGTTDAMQEKMLSHNRTEQESLTSSLLSMAQALKQSSQAFASSLESDREVLDHAGEGMERSTTSIEAAQRRMGYLRRMSEGKGWWGRMLLYAWIFGLMFVAFFIVAFMPKLRF
ncbi:MAG: hypothetical protein M1818_004136 [Claussenomyces sp. TS43310]|nr:MAG: hypothetical protein M1818_004136 [Claussenomyces sp. TS43310]